MPMETALLAERLPSHSERMSVMRKVTAKGRLPKVWVQPKAFMTRRTSMLATMVAIGVRA